jgi:tetratricopeptide (TPR) repeat protein
MRTPLLLAILALLAAPAAAIVAIGAGEPSDDLAALEAARLEAILSTMDVLEAKGDVTEMISTYRKGLAISPADLSLRERYANRGIQVLGYALRHKGDPAAILELLDEYEKYVGDEIKLPSVLWWMRTAAFERLGRNEDAAALKQKALEHKADDPEYHRAVAYFLLDTGLFEGAIAEFDVALSAAPNDWFRGVCIWGMGAAYLSVEDYENAADKYEAAVTLFKETHQPRNYDTLIEDAGDAMYELGRSYSLRGEYKKAIAANERALALMPEQLDETLGEIASRNLIAIADIELEQGKAKQALDPLERARKLAPESPSLYSTLVDAYTKLGDKTEAANAAERCEKLYRAFIDAHPDRPLGYNNLAWFFATHDTKLDEALELSKKSVEMSPTTAAYIDTLAEIYHRQGDNDKALETIAKVFDLDPKPPHLIYYEQQRDKFEKAKRRSH